MSYQDGFRDALDLVESWLEECGDLECIERKLRYYRSLVRDKKVEQIKYQLKALY